MSEAQIQATPVRDGPEGIGGWLILPVIGLVLTPIRGLLDLSVYSGLGETFPLLDGAQKTFLVIEIVGNLALAIILPIVLLVLLFNKKQGFPRLYVIWAALNLAFIVGDLIAAHALFGDTFVAQGVELMDEETIRSLLSAVVLVAIWLPYMLVSRRVRNTFTQ